MSRWIPQDPAWEAILADPRLAEARRKLSIYEIRLIVEHARASATEANPAESVLCPVCLGRCQAPGGAVPCDNCDGTGYAMEAA